MFIPFLPLADVDAILDMHFEAEAQRSEIEAELGSSHFMGGASSWDASTFARLEMDERETEFNASPEGERYKARLEAAQFMRSAITGDMKVADYHDSDGFSFVILGATFVPEFIPDLIRTDFLRGIESSDDELPF